MGLFQIVQSIVQSTVKSVKQSREQESDKPISKANSKVVKEKTDQLISEIDRFREERDVRNGNLTEFKPELPEEMANLSHVKEIPATYSSEKSEDKKTSWPFFGTAEAASPPERENDSLPNPDNEKPKQTPLNIIEKFSSGVPSSINVVSEKSKLGEFLDNHLDKFLKEALEEFKQKSIERSIWADRIWYFTLMLVLFIVLVISANFFITTFTAYKSVFNEKLIFALITGMFAQIISIIIVIMKYVFSPSKDVYSYLTELVKARKLKDGHDAINDASNGGQIIISEGSTKE